MQTNADLCKPIRTCEHQSGPVQTNAVSASVCTGPHWSARVSVGQHGSANHSGPVQGFRWSIAVAKIATDQARVSGCVRQAPGVLVSEEAAKLLRLHAPPVWEGCVAALILGCCAHMLLCCRHALLMCCFTTLQTLNTKLYLQP